MPRVDVDGFSVNYEVQGEGEPLLLIPYTSADHACYAFQLPGRRVPRRRVERALVGVSLRRRFPGANRRGPGARRERRAAGGSRLRP